jgi:hypothetical protein
VILLETLEAVSSDGLTMERNVASGYLIVKTFERMYREYIELRATMKLPLPDDKVICSIPWNEMPPQACAKQYRGAARDPLFHDSLNRHAFFDTPEAAKVFIDYYLSFGWTERGPYVITEVRSADEGT